MALTFEETKELEELKQDHRIKLLKLTQEAGKEEHFLKMLRLNKQLEIAQASAKQQEE